MPRKGLTIAANPDPHWFSYEDETPRCHMCRDDGEPAFWLPGCMGGAVYGRHACTCTARPPCTFCGFGKRKRLRHLLCPNCGSARLTMPEPVPMQGKCPAWRCRDCGVKFIVTNPSALTVRPKYSSD